MPFTYRLAPLFIAITIMGCQSESTTSASPIDQSHICETKEWQYSSVASECKPGQKVAFLPDSWGNEQLPIIFAAVNCDLRYSIVSTKGGVTCIYGPITPKPAESQKPNPDNAAPAK